MKQILLSLIAILCITSFSCTTPQAVSADTGRLEITETYWRLTELKGKPVKPSSPDKKDAYFKLKKNGNVEGFAGCNGFGGHFELADSSHITFSNIMGTMMACADLQTENKFYEVLHDAETYVHNGKHLLLIKGNKSPMARFEADYAK